MWYMRAFYLAWTNEVENLQRSVGDSDRQILQRAIGESSPSGPPAVVAQIPWGQNIELITKLKNPLQRLWYAQQTTANGWSRNMLVHFRKFLIELGAGFAFVGQQVHLPVDALRNVSTPVGVARYTTKLMESLPAELKDSLPSPEAIEAELESEDRKRSSVETEYDADLNADYAQRKPRRG
jgi:hypothetical protein